MGLFLITNSQAFMVYFVGDWESQSEDDVIKTEIQNSVSKIEGVLTTGLRSAILNFNTEL
jgi:hypothetical protein